MIADVVALRGDCRRKQHGAVIAKEHRIVSVGYNGSPAGSTLSCLAGDCPRAALDEDLGDDFSNCIALHAEQNAIAYVNRADSIGASIYVTGMPCDMCAKLIRAAGITRVLVRAEGIEPPTTSL